MRSSGYHPRKRRRGGSLSFGDYGERRRKLPIVSLLVLIAFSIAIGTGAYLVANGKMNSQNGEKRPEHSQGGTVLTATPAATPTAVPAEPDTENDYVSLVRETYGTYPDGFLSDFVDTRTRTEVKGVYVNTNRLGMKGYATIDELIELADKTEINAMVIDLKDDYGNILYDSKIPLVDELGAEVRIIPDLKAFVSKLKEHNIYCIARVVAMKDMIATRKHPQFAVRNKDGSVFLDSEGNNWLNPYSKEAWEYLTAIAKEAVEAGFDEINFDYLRTSSSNSLDKADFGEIPEGMSRMDAIIAFVKYACENLKPLGAFVSGDVFATIINSVSDGARIGQSYVELSKYLDYICPMVYPSHYSYGYGGIKYPDKEPFALLLMEMKSSVKKLSVIPEGQFKAEVRPWLQDFTATWLDAGAYKKYGAIELREQISATYSAGYNSFFLWNAGMFYSEDGLLTE